MTEPDDRVRSIFPQPIKRGYLVKIKIQVADVFAGVVARVAEVFAEDAPRVNNFVTFGQIVDVFGGQLFVGDDVHCKIFGRSFDVAKKPIP